MQKIDDHEIHISVRTLVEFIFRSGDLDSSPGAGRNKEAMLEGSRIHRKLQKAAGSLYQAEVPLKESFCLDESEGLFLVLEGRADGIFTDRAEEELQVIDEIKSVYRDVKSLEEPVQVHRAQALCYAYIRMKQENLPKIGVQMTYCRIGTEEIRRFRETLSGEELEAWFLSLLEQYRKWFVFLYQEKQKRLSTTRSLQFPFPYRTGQRDLVVDVYRSMARGRNLFVQAPTGIGKTMSVVFPAVKAMGEGIAEKMFYLTAKNVTRQVAEESLHILREKGLHFSAVTLTAKEKICPMETCVCRPEVCPRAKGHYDRVNDALFELITSFQEIGFDAVQRTAEKYCVCPFELSLDATDWTDGILCDYNYVFDPNVNLKRYFSDNVSGRYLFLVDEAHNLVDRAREMYSASLVKEDFLLVKKQVKLAHGKLGKLLDRCSRAFLELRKECEETWQVREEIGSLYFPLLSLMGEMEDVREKNPGLDLGEDYRQLYFKVRHFLAMYENAGEDYQIYCEKQSDGTFLVRLFCVQPAANLRNCLDKSVQTVFFSATLLPVNYYRRLLGGKEDDYAVYIPSPFEEKKRLLLISRDVSSRYTGRGPAQYQRMAQEIYDMTKVRKGHYLAFFPSYAFLAQVEEKLQEYVSEKWRLLSQDPGMKESDKNRFLEEFRHPEDGITRLGLCVLGGAFSEGIDLTGEKLIGVCVVGIGYAQVCTERTILKNYFDAEEKRGFDYAYRFPGMNKVQQAAGRVIRTVEDEGVILLMDDRFLEPDNLAMFPREWENYHVVTAETLPSVIRTFWEERAAGSE